LDQLNVSRDVFRRYIGTKFVRRDIMRDFGFEVDRIVDLDSGNIELKLSFRKDD
jgi:hypothetical protein